MTQEELDALMADSQMEQEFSQENVDITSDEKAQDTQDLEQDTQDLDTQDLEQDTQDLDILTANDEPTQDSNQEMPDNFRVSADAHWPPPPPTDDHKMVRQLDDVTRDSEEKATQVLDKLDAINTLLVSGEEYTNSIKEILTANFEIFSKLSEKFTHISSFSEQKENCKKACDDLEEILDKFQNGQNGIMDIIDMMQYQDIHRQKIERVINVMRALSKYMSSLFESDIDDKNRVPSAVHLEGDKTENLLSDDDIEALINSFAKK